MDQSKLVGVVADDDMQCKYSAGTGVGDAAQRAEVEREYSVYVCEAHTAAVTAQCVFYGLWYLGFTVAGFVLAGTAQSQNGTELFDLNMSVVPDACNNPDGCSRTEDALRNADVMLDSAAVYAVSYVLQTMLLVVATILIRRPKYQRRWRVVSTWLLVLAGLVGPVMVNVCTATWILSADVAPILKLSAASAGDVRAVLLDALLVGFNQRYSGLTALSLLAFAPPFRSYAGVCAVLAAVEMGGEVAQVHTVADMINADSPGWAAMISRFGLTLYGQPVFSVLVGYLVPIGLLWIFERMLRNSFRLQQMLKSKAKSLYKEAHPFAVWTIKDWVETLASDGSSGGSPASLGNSASPEVAAPAAATKAHIAMRTNPSQRRRQKHPWELDSSDLELDTVIGAGTHGKVYRGRYKGGDVAVKTLFVLPEDGDVNGAISDRLFADTAAEAEALSRLRHVNMMRFYGICFLAQQRSIAMVTELCALDLREWIDMPQGHSDEEVWRVASQVAQGLVHLHEDAGMVHRDLKPSNILLTHQGVVKLCDFGISSTSDRRSADGGGGGGGGAMGQGPGATGTVAVEATGTTEYMAPECFDREFQSTHLEGTASRRHIIGDGAGGSLAALRPVDIYAYGCIAWELFARRAIWEEFSSDSVGLVAAVRNGERPDLQLARFGDTAATARMRRWVESCWAADPRSRPRAREVARAIEALRNGGPRAVTEAVAGSPHSSGLLL